MFSPMPTQTPEDILRRVLRVARLDGMSVLVIAGGFAGMEPSAMATNQTPPTPCPVVSPAAASFTQV